MSGWVKLATNFYRHPKALAAGPDGRNLYLAALAWAGDYNTDGALPAYALSTWALDAGVPWDNAGQVADRLVEVRLWDRTPDGWKVHDWSDWQTTSEERNAKQLRERERKAAWRAKRSELSRGTDTGRDAGQPPDATWVSALTDVEAETDRENPLPPPQLSAVRDHPAGSGGTPPAPRRLNPRALGTNPRAQAQAERQARAAVCNRCGEPRHEFGMPCPTILAAEDRA